MTEPPQLLRLTEEVAKMKISAVLLAGGQSRRFGRDKTAIELDGQSLLTRQAGLCAALCDELIVSGRSGLPDNFPGLGPLAGIEAGLRQAKHPLCLVLAADLPLMDARLMRCLIENWPGEDCEILLPLREGRPEPLCGLYRRELAERSAELLRSGQRSVRALCERSVCRYLPEEVWRAAVGDRQVFFNLNRPEDHQRLLELWAAEKNEVSER